MINVSATREPNAFSIQKAYVSYRFIDCAFKYATIPITEDLKSVCQLVPRSDIHDDFCILDYSVVQYSTQTSLTKVIHSLSLNPAVRKEDIRVLGNVVDAKMVDISIVFDKSSHVQKWATNEELLELIRSILLPYVVVNVSLIAVPTSKVNRNEILYICVHTTSAKKSASRITSSTVVNIRQLMSLNKFERQCSSRSCKMVGLSNQITFLDSVYNANLVAKRSQVGSRIRCVQKLLIIGPPGCGKTSLVRSFVETKKCGLVVIEGSELTHSTPGESENILRLLFEEAVQRSKETDEDICVVLLDQIDNICRKSQSIKTHLRRISYQLFQILETTDESPGLIVIATTNDVHALDPAFRQASRIEVEMYIGMPSERERQEILQLYYPKLKSAVCKKIAAYTPGYNGADLAFLARNVDRMRRKSPDLYQNDSELLQLFSHCLTIHRPSSLRDGLGVTRLGNMQMSSLGGLENIKSCLRSFIEWPLNHPKAFKRLGIPIPKGVLLYGPPGCAKTSLACAVANDTNTNFLSVSAAELYSPYVGEAERNVAELFHKARVNSPCIVFIDEIDALVGNRNTTSKNVQSKILSTFLTEMDGVGNKVDWSIQSRVMHGTDEEKSKDRMNIVIVIAATNRPDKLDSALLRPGRFDKLIYVGPPDAEDRLDILRTIVRQRKMPLSACVDLTEIARNTDYFSGADLMNLMKEAGYTALFREDMTASRIKQEHIINSLTLVRPSLRAEVLDSYQRYRAAEDV